MNSKETENVAKSFLETLQQERDELRGLLCQLVDGDVGRNTLWKLSEGQGTETPDGKTWLAAKAVADRANSSPPLATRETENKTIPPDPDAQHVEQ